MLSVTLVAAIEDAIVALRSPGQLPYGTVQDPSKARVARWLELELAEAQRSLNPVTSADQLPLPLPGDDNG